MASSARRGLRVVEMFQTRACSWIGFIRIFKAGDDELRPLSALCLTLMIFKKWNEVYVVSGAKWQFNIKFWYLLVLLASDWPPVSAFEFPSPFTRREYRFLFVRSRLSLCYCWLTCSMRSQYSHAIPILDLYDVIFFKCFFF